MKEEILKLIRNTILIENNLFLENKIWKQPLISFINTNDPEFLKIKKITHKDHLLPNEILNSAQSIICFFIPFEDEIIKSNISDYYASTEWALTYIRTNKLIGKIGNNIELFMNKAGYEVGKIPATHNFKKEILVSNWSHRHIAYLGGLGSFGINNMLITENGCCGRFGSIVTNYYVEDKVKIVEEKCLNKINKSCGVCIKKCISNAYENNEFNKFKCYEVCLENVEKHKDIGYADVCGKCLVGLPCSSKDPHGK
ncbi:MAG: hypothetical protein PHV82_09515 [Victivallaceae bacterium]|nr:hypothetical protein [Victivallaceae bacterium]